ncbi:MAG: branched-chain amino acid aminotransferase [Planctomycetaceae bacterium]|nr:branched-chain amino acid aminotransferase [Planctomycetaceae bacterium]
MRQLFTRLYNDECGLVQSAELVLIATITVIGMVVGLSEVTWNVNQELKDVGNAFGAVNQSYSTFGSSSSSSATSSSQLDFCG